MSDSPFRQNADLRAATRLAHDAPQDRHSVTPPVFQSSLFCFDTVEEMAARFRGENQAYVYSRGDNPGVEAFEQKIAALEGAEAARAFSSGMGAISATLMSLLQAGARVVCVRDVYADTYRFLEKLMSRYGVRTEYVDGCDRAALAAALPGASVLYLESPTSWTFRTQDLAHAAQAARAHGVVTVCDNSWATPLHQQPLALGIDLVLHSASKYIGGHSDTVAGVVAGSKARIAALNALSYPYLGAKLAPWEAWLLLRGMRTLDVRLRAQWACAEALMEKLASHAAVRRILHPAWQCGPGNQYLHGFSSLFSIELDAAYDPLRFCNALRLFKRGVSWGGHESLALPAQVALQGAAPNAQADFGVSPALVRLYIGLEDMHDLWRDLEQGLAQAVC
ncbi:aminotransferase class I/II-fold pyridoxal phosphate-dependent enzyme [Massilia sp. W12]|uniref:aminotransferase class I/II-fold pyridoxal phosphate-dependent enzyme n=1 Tax=Massilia sp. W12 TaxID=3126507 RepID=UPI0030D30552